MVDRLLLIALELDARQLWLLKTFFKSFLSYNVAFGMEWTRHQFTPAMITRTRKSPEYAFGIVALLQTNQCHKASPDPRNPS
jgi:hypothetical protein